MDELIELLPLPSVLLNWPHPTNHVAIRDYARACVAHATTAKDAEIEAMRAKTAMTMGVGTGDGKLFVHGDYESIKAAQEIVLERDGLRAEVERLTGCLATANANHEQFERQWYLERDCTERLAEALDIIARVGKASRNQTTRTRWIVARAVSALNNDDDWRALPKPNGFHDALLRPTSAQENDDA